MEHLPQPLGSLTDLLPDVTREEIVAQMHTEMNQCLMLASPQPERLYRPQDPDDVNAGARLLAGIF